MHSQLLCMNASYTNLYISYMDIFQQDIEKSFSIVSVKAEPHTYRNRITCMHRNRNPCNSFLVVKMASGMDQGCVRPTTATNDNVAQYGSHPANTRSCSLGLKHIMSLILDIHMMFY